MAPCSIRKQGERLPLGIPNLCFASIFFSFLFLVSCEPCEAFCGRLFPPELRGVLLVKEMKAICSCLVVIQESPWFACLWLERTDLNTSVSRLHFGILLSRNDLLKK